MRLLQVDSIDCTSFPATELFFDRRRLSLGADVRRTCLMDAIDRFRSMDEFPMGIDPLGLIFTGDSADPVINTGAAGMNPLSSCFIAPSRLSIVLFYRAELILSIHIILLCCLPVYQNLPGFTQDYCFSQ